MKALVYTGVEQLDYRDVPDAVPADDEAVVRIMASGICGSDMHAYLGHDARRPAPLTLGHEAAGVVVGGPMDGTRVTINPLVTCGACAACLRGCENLCPERQIISMPPREGAFAQYVAIPRGNLVEVPDGISFETAALCEPIAVGWHTVQEAYHALHADHAIEALVYGGGAIGLASALALRVLGVGDITIVEPNTDRAKYLREKTDFKIAKAVNSTPSLIIDAVGIEATRKQASDIIQPGGVIAHVGLGDNADGLDVRRMTLQEITFIGTYTYSAQDFRDTAAAMFDGSLGPLDWIETRPLSDGHQAFKDIRAGRVAAPKIILTPDHEE